MMDTARGIDSLRDGKLTALKMTNALSREVSGESDKRAVEKREKEDLRHEVAMMSCMDSERLVKAFAYYDEPFELGVHAYCGAIVMELMEGGDLSKAIKVPDLDVRSRVRMSIEICE